MGSAEKRQIVGIGLAVFFGPFSDMVDIAPGWWSVAAGEGAAAVPNDHRSAYRGGGLAASAAQIQRLAHAAQHRGDDTGVAGEHAQLRGGEDAAVVEQRGAVEGEPAEVDQCVGLPFVEAEAYFWLWRGERVDGGGHGGEPGRVQLAADQPAALVPRDQPQRGGLALGLGRV